MAEFFRRLRDDDGRCGLYVMEENTCGAFFHGDRAEVQPPYYNAYKLKKWATEGGFISVEQMSRAEFRNYVVENQVDLVYPELLAYIDKLDDTPITVFRTCRTSLT